MSGDCIATIEMAVEVQQNGIIRDLSTLHIIGRLTRDTDYDNLQKVSNDHVIYTVDEMEHILNCFDNLFYIHEQSPETQAEWLETIHKACHDARMKWVDVVRRKLKVNGGEVETQ